MVHGEGYDAIRFLTDRLERDGQTAPYFHGTSRPQTVEREATHRAISHAEIVDVPIMIVHVSGREAMEQIRWAQQRGLKVYAETCPQYIVLTAEDMKGLNMDMSGAKVCLLAAAARQGKPAGDLGRYQRRRVSDLLIRPLPVSLRRSEGQADAEGAHVVPLGAERNSRRRDAAADLVLGRRVEGPDQSSEIRRADLDQSRRIYGLYPRKGSIGVGFDADIVLWDPNLKETIRQSDLHHGSDYTPYEGFEVTGWPVTTIARGRVVADNGKIVGAKGCGRNDSAAASRA